MGSPSTSSASSFRSRPSRRSTSRGRRASETRAHCSAATTPQTAARNLLIWGDNKLVMSSLLADYAGKVKLIYIDPPFDTGR